MDQQMMAAALMGGQNSAMPSQIQQQPDPMQFSAQNLGYGMPAPAAGQMQNHAGAGGMFTLPPGGQAQMNAYPVNMSGYNAQ